MGQIPGQGMEQGGIRPGNVAYVGYAIRQGSGDTVSYGSLDNPTAPAGRLYFAQVGQTGGQKSFTALTVGGNAATKITPHGEGLTSFTPRQWFYYDHPGGTIGALVGTTSGSGTMGNAGIVCFVLTDFDNVTIVGGDSIGNNSSFTSQTMTAMPARLAGDWTLTASWASTATTKTQAWTGTPVEVLDFWNDPSDNIIGAALIQEPANLAANTNITDTYSGTVSNGPITAITIRGIAA